MCSPVTASKALSSCGSPSPLDTIEITSASPLNKSLSKEPERTSYEWLKDGKAQNQKVSKQFFAIGHQAEGEAYPLLMGIGNKLKKCATYAGLRELPTGELFRIGGNYCKCKACSVCSYLVSMKRKKAILHYFQENPAALAGRYVYHMVFTLKHDQATRSGDYTQELKEHFKRLRDGRGTRQFWKDHVEGGFYSMEVIGNQSPNPKDKSLHIHLHVILVSPQRLEKTRFARVIRSAWVRMTGDSNQVFLERVYRLTDEGKKEFYFPGMGQEALEQAFAESVKYTLKLDFEYQGISPETLAGLFKPHKRFFGFFGSLYGKGIATFDHEQISELSSEKNGLFSPSTGEIFEPEQTRLLITPFWNLQSLVVEGCQSYDLQEQANKFYVPSVEEMVCRLSRINDYRYSVGRESQPALDPPSLRPSDLADLAEYWDSTMTPAQRHHERLRQLERDRQTRWQRLKATRHPRPGPNPDQTTLFPPQNQ